MKSVKKLISVLLIVTLISGCFGLNISASDGLLLPDYTMTEAQWDEYWSTVEGDNTQIALTPGSDETELNLNWHSERKAAVPMVKIADNAAMENAKVFYGYSTLADNNQQTNRVTVTGLEENTRYYYSYSLGKDNWSEPEFYITRSADSFKALLVGDIQCSAVNDQTGYTDASNWNRLLNTALRNNPDTSFIISCGDQTQTGASAVEWAATLSPKAMRNLPMATTIGNHDHKGTTYKHYVNNPNSQLISTSKSGTPYWFRYGDVLFVVFNTTNINVFESHALAEKAIEANKDAKWRVAVFHHDIYGTGHHACDDDNYLLQGVFSAILDKFEFDLAFDGHEHYYGRSYNMLNNEIVDLDYTANKVTDPDGTLYITTASASGKNRVYDEPYDHSWINFSYMSEELVYSEVEFTTNTFNIKTYAVDGNRLIDEYTIEKTDFTYSDIDTSETLFDTDALDRVLSHFMGDYYVIYVKITEVIKFLLYPIKTIIG